jgi:hypothetical protein
MSWAAILKALTAIEKKTSVDNVGRTVSISKEA